MLNTSMPHHIAEHEERELARIYEGEEMTPAQEASLQSIDTLGYTLIAEFEEAITMKQSIEERFIKDLRQYKGIYEPEIQAMLDEDTERSNAFFRKTAAKVRAVTGKMYDLLMSGRRTWDIKPKNNPELPEAKQQEVRELLAQAHSTPEKTITPEDVPQEAVDDAAVQVATQSAQKMVKVIDDQLKAARFKAGAKQVLFSGNLYGTGILKGPLTEVAYTKEYQQDGKTGKFQLLRKKTKQPFFKSVSVFNYYPDLNTNCQQDCRYEWEHHRLTRQGLAALTERAAFAIGKQAIIDWITAHPRGLTRLFQYENDLRLIGDRDLTGLHTQDTGLYDVFERSGWLSAEELMSAGVVIPADRRHEAFYSNVWLLPSGKVIKCRLAPSEGVQTPYKLYRFEDDATCIFSEGIACLMRDDQRRINAAHRAAEDNLGITSGPQVEINTDMIKNVGSDVTIAPFGKWFRSGGDAKDPAVRFIDVPSKIAELFAASEKWEACADELTQIPKLIHGEGPVEAAAALSMRLGQINGAIKDLVQAFEEGVGEPVITDTYAWNMRFNPDDSIKGSFQVEAMGATSLIAQEVQVQQAMQFGGSVHPNEEKYVDRYTLLKKRAELQGFGDAVKDRDAADAEANSEQAKMEQQLAMQMQNAQLAKLTAEAAQKEAQAAKTAAETLLVEARAMNEKMSAAFAAMQAGGAATQSPAVAAAGDALLQAGGWKDAHADQPEAAAAGAEQPVPPPVSPAAPQPTQPDAGAQPVDANVGENAGIETPQIEEMPGA